MNENFFFNNFFYNFLPSFLFLSINFLTSLSLSQKNYFSKIYNFGPHLIFAIIISFYAFLINLIFLFSFTKYLSIFVFFLIFLNFILLIFLNEFSFNKFFISIKKAITYKYILVFLFALFLISIMPLSDADSVATHLFIPGQILENGLLSNDLIKHVENVVISNTESILTLSFVLKSDNFGSQLNFFSLLIFFLTFNKNKNFFYILLFSPLIIFFISTQKLQLFFALLYLNLFILVYENKVRSNFEIFVFVFLLTFYSSGKITYILFSTFLFLLFLFKNKHSFKISFFFLFICFFIHHFPILLYKFILFDNPFAPFFDHYFKDREALNAFAYSLRSSGGWLLGNVPFSVFIQPFISFDPFTFTTSFGLVFLFLLFDLNKIQKLFFIPYLIIISIFFSGQLVPRYYLEAFLLLAFYANYTLICKIVNYFQGFCIILFSVIFLWLSFFNLQKDNWLKKEFSRKFAYHYLNAELLKNKEINGNVLVLFFTRDNIFFEKNIYSSRYLFNTNSFNNDYDQNFKNFLNNTNIKYIVFEDQSGIPSCIELNIYDEINFKIATRNFLSKHKEQNFKIARIVKNECLFTKD